MEYYRTRGSWWLGASTALQSTRYQWHGEQRSLVGALNDGARENPGLGWGAQGGRQWPSGLRLSAGVNYERSQQDFRWVERRTEVHTETVTNMVTLNTLVVFADVDTLNTVVVHEERMEGSDSRTSIQVPIELAWHADWKRWRFGPRVGFYAEHTSVRPSASMVQDAQSGTFRLETLGRETLNRRYPFTVSGVVGLDLGFGWHERWLVVATPFIGHGLASFNASDEAFAQSRRFGLRIQLCHTL